MNPFEKPAVEQLPIKKIKLGKSIPENSIHTKEKKNQNKINHLHGGQFLFVDFTLSIEHSQQQDLRSKSLFLKACQDFIQL